MTHSAPNANAMWPAAWPSGMVSARSVRGSIRSRLSAGAAPVELANAQMLSLLAASRAWVTAGTSSREVTRFVAGSIRTIPAAVQAQTDPNPATRPWHELPSTSMAATISFVAGSIRTMAGSG